MQYLIIALLLLHSVEVYAKNLESADVFRSDPYAEAKHYADNGEYFVYSIVAASPNNGIPSISKPELWCWGDNVEIRKVYLPDYGPGGTRWVNSVARLYAKEFNRIMVSRVRELDFANECTKK